MPGISIELRKRRKLGDLGIENDLSALGPQRRYKLLMMLQPGCIDDNASGWKPARRVKVGELVIAGFLEPDEMGDRLDRCNRMRELPLGVPFAI